MKSKIAIISKVLILNIVACIFSLSPEGSGWKGWGGAFLNKMKIIFFSVGILLLFGMGEAALAQVPTALGSYQWVKGFGSFNQQGITDEMVNAIKLDNEGNTIVCGRVMGYTYVQGLGGNKDSLISNRWQNANNFQGFISKYDCSGNLLWFRELNDSVNGTEIYDIVIDSLNNIYALGTCEAGGENIYFNDSLFAPYSFPSPFQGPVILLALNKNGNMKWNYLQPIISNTNNFSISPQSQNASRNAMANLMVLHKDTISILAHSGSTQGSITIGTVTIKQGYSLIRFTTNGALADAVWLDSMGYCTGFGIDSKGDYIAGINFMTPINKFLDSTFTRPTASFFNQFSTIIKFNRHHVIRHIEFGDSTACYNGDFSNLGNGLNLKGKGRTGLKMFGNYTLKTKSALWGANTLSGAILHFEDLFNYKWTACSDSSYSMGGFNSCTQDVNGDIYTDVAFNQYLKYQNLIVTTPAMGANSFLIKIKRFTELIENRLPDFTILNANTSSSYIRIQNFLTTKLGNIYLSGNLKNNQVIVGIDTAKYYGGNNDMFVIRYGNPCSNSAPIIAAGTPSGLVAKCNGTSISLSWQKLNNGEDKYYIYRSLAATSGFVKIDSVAPTTNTYTDANVVTKTNYWYAVSSHNIVGEGYLSMVDSARLCDDIGGISNLNATQLAGQLYPNPTTGEFNLFIQSSEINATAQLQISNYVGQVILNKTVSLKNSNNFKLDVSDYAGGIYLVTLKTAQSRYSEKLILVK
ncbi:MAG: hypothetical protein RJA07_2422 [Bacteroidota bacterium]|jgi:hypothetical protein